MGLRRITPHAAPVVSLAHQNVEIRRRFPGFTNRGVPGRAHWVGALQPTELSSRFEVRIRYRLGDVPRVFVIPQITMGAPHVYWAQDGRLCLYYPKDGGWRRDMIIAETIIPWTALWLRYYELWLDTGKWLGPSPHGDAVKDRERLDGN
jgi:hypothetical protein